ncbi:MAG: hypothetical protein HY007_01840 [Candidatus Sungbacteria bacterium]|nr:hypothetical protein [Candidatus Sungbacteria bacterium]
MNKNISKIIVAAAITVAAGVIFFHRALAPQTSLKPAEAEAASFEYLSSHGNSSCSGAFLGSIPAVDDSTRLMGSCCSPMVKAKYEEQVKGLKQYKDIPEIPVNPYNIPATQVKRMLEWQKSITLSADEQKTYDDAINMSMEHGPCCCTCWHWFAYEGLAKLLVTKYRFDGKAVAHVWDLSDGCGGDDHHDT